jgi:hypothetical protein
MNKMKTVDLSFDGLFEPMKYTFSLFSGRCYLERQCFGGWDPDSGLDVGRYRTCIKNLLYTKSTIRSSKIETRG